MQRPKRVREGARLAQVLEALRGEHPRIHIPITVVSEERNGTVPREIGRALADALPNARLVEIPGGRHTLPVLRPELLAGLVDELAREISPSSRFPVQAKQGNMVARPERNPP